MHLSKSYGRMTSILVILVTIPLLSLVSAQSLVRNVSLPEMTNNCDFCLASQGISPLEVGSSGFRLDIRYLRVGEMFRNGIRVENSDKELETHLTQQFSFFYALSSRWTMSAIAPVANRHSEVLADDGSTISGNQFGLGDMSLLMRYKPLVVHSMERTYILSLTAGWKVPTGRTDGRDSRGNLLDAHMQLGTGSTDFLGGANGFLTFDRVAVIVNLLGGITSHGANGHTFGNSLNYGATVRYKVYPEEYDLMQVFGTLGVDGEWRGEEIQDGHYDENSGGNVTYLSPGMQVFLSPSISIEAVFQYPFLHGLRGEQLGEEYRIMTGVQLLL